MTITRVSQKSFRRGLERYNNVLADYVPERGAFDSIATVTLGSAQTTITFSSIPSTYKHLQVRGLLQASTATNDLGIYATVNGDTTAANYRGHYVGGIAQTVYVAEITGSPWAGYYAWAVPGNSTVPATFAGIVMTVFDYSNTSKYKTSNTYSGYTVNNTTTGTAESAYCSSVWMNTAAVNSLTFKIGNGSSFSTGSRLSLYGMK